MEKVYLQMASFHMSGSPLELSGKLEAAASLGYTGIELGSMDFAPLGFDGFAAKARQLELEVLSAHVKLPEIPAALEQLKQLGAKYVVVPTYDFHTIAQTEELAATLNEMGKQVKGHGLSLGYHNHQMEFEQAEGKYLLDLLLGLTDPELVFLECDVGWAAASGADVLDFLRRNAARIRLLHANESDSVIGPYFVGRMPNTVPSDAQGNKLYTPEEADFHHRRKVCDCPMGKGLLDWQQVRESARCAEAYIVERRYAYVQPLETCLAEDLAFVKKL